MKRSLFESRRWILNAARDRDTKNIRIHETLANVLIDTANNTGRVIAQRNEHHKTYKQNRAYAHYRVSSQIKIKPIIFSFDRFFSKSFLILVDKILIGLKTKTTYSEFMKLFRSSPYGFTKFQFRVFMNI